MTPEYEFATTDLTQHLYHFAKKDAVFLTEDPKKKAAAPGTGGTTPSAPSTPPAPATPANPPASPAGA
jgi:hypothetical protein